MILSEALSKASASYGDPEIDMFVEDVEWRVMQGVSLRDAIIESAAEVLGVYEVAEALLEGFGNLESETETLAEDIRSLFEKFAVPKEFGGEAATKRGNDLSPDQWGAHLSKLKKEIDDGKKTVGRPKAKVDGTEKTMLGKPEEKPKAKSKAKPKRARGLRLRRIQSAKKRKAEKEKAKPKAKPEPEVKKPSKSELLGKGVPPAKKEEPKSEPKKEKPKGLVARVKHAVAKIGKAIKRAKEGAGHIKRGFHDAVGGAAEVGQGVQKLHTGKAKMGLKRAKEGVGTVKKGWKMVFGTMRKLDKLAR
jgi:hypothetical protein